MEFYSFCAEIPKEPSKLQRAEEKAESDPSRPRLERVSIGRLITDEQYRQDIRQRYEPIVSAQRPVGPVFEAVGGIIRRLEGPVFRVQEKIVRGDAIGSGAFGEVRLATLDEDSWVRFALKRFNNLDPSKWNSTKECIFEEIKSYARLDHDNIIKFYGVLFTDTNAKMEIIMEEMNKGSLWTWLHNKGDPVSYATQLHIARQLARGLKFMTEQGFVHCDIAARNCLLHEHDGQLVAKIGDMGLTRKLYTGKYYAPRMDKRLTIRWMSPENIETNKFTVHGDCWAFGVVLWEIATGCDGDPYSEFANEEQLAKAIIGGSTLSQPRDCPDQLYHIMKRCWVRNPHERATIQRVKTQLETLRG